MNLMQLLSAVLLLVLGLLINNLWFNESTGVKRLAELEKELEIQKSEHERLVSNNERIEQVVNGIKYSVEAREELARKHLGLFHKYKTFFHFTQADLSHCQNYPIKI